MTSDPEATPARDEQTPLAAETSPPPRVRIVEVAAAAGVSQATASKALLGSPGISEATRARVQLTARRLGYRPNVLARTLKGWHSQSIGVLTDDMDGFFSLSMLGGIEDLANARGYSVFICNTLGDSRRERSHLLALLDKQVDGIIILGSYMKGRGEPAVDPLGVPCVYLYCYEQHERFPSIVPGDHAGARDATNHLIQSGHRRIAFLNGPAVDHEPTANRLAGYRDALAAAGIPFDPALVRASPTDWDPRAGFDMVRDVLDSGPAPDAVFAASDYLALGAMLAMQSAGLRVPEDVSIIGFDDRPIAAGLPTPLTTMALPQKAMGRQATEILLAAISGENVEPVRHVVAPALVERETVMRRAAPAPGSSRS